MNETSTFAVLMYGLAIACVAEHMIKHKNYYKGTTQERIGLFVVRAAMVVLVLGVMGTVPRCTSNPGYDNEEQADTSPY